MYVLKHLSMNFQTNFYKYLLALWPVISISLSGLRGKFRCYRKDQINEKNTEMMAFVKKLLSWLGDHSHWNKFIQN